MSNLNSPTANKINSITSKKRANYIERIISDKKQQNTVMQ